MTHSSCRYKSTSDQSKIISTALTCKNNGIQLKIQKYATLRLGKYFEENLL